MKMKDLFKIVLIVVIITAITGCGERSETGTTANKPGSSVETRIGTLNFTHEFTKGYPSNETQQKLFDELDFQRACQVYIWATPIVSFAQWQYAHNEMLGAENGQIVFMESYEDKLGGLTFNTTTPYAVPFIDLNEGPWVIEMPEAEVRGVPTIFGKLVLLR